MTGKNIKIRQILSDELEQVRTLAMDIWPRAYRNIIGPDKVDAMLCALYDLEALEKEMSDGQVFFIARYHDYDVAYASALLVGRCLWLKKLYCRHEFRGLSIGQMLIDQALRTFPSANSLSLNVNKDNEAAIHYYQKHGFSVDAEVPVKMGSFEFTDLIMKKALRIAA